MSEKEEAEKTIDVVSDQERELAQNALNEYKKKNFGAALQFINKLDSRVNDFKVVHNKALLEYCKSDFKKNETFQKNLNNLCNQFRIKIEKLDDVDYCIVHYNQAILLFHQRKYTEAIKIMDRVYKYIEPMDDALAKQVSLFAIELQLSIKQPEKALSLISYLENQLINGTPNIKILDKTVKEKEKKIQHPPDPATEEFKKKLLKYKIRCYLMNHQLDISTNEIQVLSKQNPNYNSLFLLANLEYLKGNYQESMKVLNSIPNNSLIYNETGESSSVFINNNLGILYQVMGKPNLACFQFQTAIKEDMSLTSNNAKAFNDKSLFTIGGSRYHELVYNLGISLLYSGKTNQAFECFIIAVRRYHRNSRIWMRLAECCIMIHKETNAIDYRFRKKQLTKDIIGVREKQKVILTSNLSNDKKYSTESQSYAVPVPTLEFASLCLKNALYWLPSETQTNPMPLFLIPGVTPPVPSSVPGNAPSSPLVKKGVPVLRNCILVASSYVCLCLGDYILALEHAKTLLEQPQISKTHEVLGHLYSAEALVLLNRVTEAFDHLNPEIMKDIDFQMPLDKINFDENEQTKNEFLPKWFPNNMASVHATLQYNLAVAKTIRGQYDEAMVLLKKVWQARCKAPAHVFMLVIYIELQIGQADAAKTLIKQYLGHRGVHV